jgi:type VI secretion system Hcp family effector
LLQNVQVLSFSQRVDVPSSLHVPTGGAAGAANVSAIQITRYIDPASPLVSLAAAQGTVIPTATIMLMPYYSPMPQYALAITLTNVLVSQAGTDSSQNNMPLERLSLSFDQIKWEFTTRHADGSAGATSITTYDVTQNQVQGYSGFNPAFLNGDSSYGPVSSQDDTLFSSLAVQLTNSATSHVGTGAGSGAAISPLSLVVPVFQDTFGEFGSALKGSSVPLAIARYSVAPTGAPFDRLRYELTNAQVISVAINTTSTGSLQETLGFDFTKIKWITQSLNDDGTPGPVIMAEWTPGSQTSHH